MGQKVGKAKFIPSAGPFLNASAPALEGLFNNFHQIAEGYGLKEAEFLRICQVEALKVSAAQARDVFRAFDSDNNGLVDALEFLTAFCLTSGLSTEAKIKFTFMCYDFDESNQLTLDEMTLSLKSTLTGLSKLCGEECPDTLDLEDIASQAFSRADLNNDGNITLEEFKEYCQVNPEVKSWIAYFDDADEDIEDAAVEASAEDEDDIADKTRIEDRPDNVEAARNPDIAHELGIDVDGESKGGDQFMAIKPWVGTVKNTVPSRPPPINKSAPQITLSLQWVHGYRAQDTRNNVMYLKTGEIAYHAAAVGIVYNPTAHTQRYNLDHTDDILCLAVHPNGRTVATGELGRSPKIVVWDAGDTEGYMDSIKVIRGFHKRAVIQMAFSPNGKLLATVGQDDDHCVAVYDWASGNKLYSDKSSRDKVFACEWRDDNTFVTCGDKHIFFWDMAAKKNAKGLFGRDAKLQKLLSLASLSAPETCVTGTESGHLYLWQGRNCTKIVQAHTGNVAGLFSCPEGLVSGGKDGKVRIWTAALAPRATFDISTFGSLAPSIRSVCWAPAKHKLLVGTLASEVYEISDTDGSNVHGRPVILGHFKDELWGLATHPAKPEYITTGDDATLRVWDANTRKIIRTVKLSSRARAVAYSPNGRQVAVGYGGDVGTGRSTDPEAGAFEVFDTTNFTSICKQRKAKEWISDVKFSPDGTLLAIGSHDNKIYIYNVQGLTSSSEPVGIANKHNSYITHFDFDVTSTHLQSNSGDYELLFYEARTGRQQVSAPKMRDVDWASWTCTLGWPVQGIWPKGADGTDINAVARSHDKSTLATADDFGRVKLFRYPVPEDGFITSQYIGHSSHVTNVRWIARDSHLITVGGNDRSVFQWECHGEADENVAEAKVDMDSDDERLLADGDKLDRSARQEAANNGMQLDLDDDSGGGDQFMAVKPWLGAIVAPSPAPPSKPTVPDAELILKWVHGFRAQDAKNNLVYSQSGEVVYTTAGVGVALNTATNKQRFNMAHTDDVICLAVHPDGMHVATGQMGAKPTVVVWRVDTMEAVAVLVGQHKRAVCAVNFSPDGRLLATVGQDDDHTVVVYDWASRAVKASAKGDKNKTLGVALAADGQTVCQVGVNHIKFHAFQGRTMASKNAVLGKKGAMQAFQCVAFIENTAVVGTTDGNLYKFMGRELGSAIKAHEGAVYALFVGERAVVSGGKDGAVRTWTRDLAPQAKFDIRALSPKASIQSVCCDRTGNKFLVGTMFSEIFEVDNRGQNLHDGPLVQGHYKNELWGLAPHPTKQQYATVGDDATIRLWDVATKKCVAKRELECMARAVAFSPNGQLLAVGTGGAVGTGEVPAGSGKLILLSGDDLRPLTSVQVTKKKEWISDIRFTPDGRAVGVGGHDRKIHIFDVADGGSGATLRWSFEKHNASITHFDFSADSHYMQSNDGAYELLFADIVGKSHITSATAVKNTEWADWTCTLGWPVQGIWPKGADGTDINAVCRSHDNKLLASADDFGKVRLFRYPCVQAGAASKEYKGHSSHVTSVRWTAGDRCLISAGGNDRSIFQWKLDADGGVEEDADADAGAAEGEVETKSEGHAAGGVEGLDAEEGGGDQFMAVKPWIGAMVPPSRPPANNPGKPAMSLDLEWVYGYRGQDSRANVWYNDAGNIVYHAAAVGIVYDKARHAQKFYFGHDDDIVCLAVDPTCNFVATGQMGRKPQIHIWDSESGMRLCTLPAFHQRAVLSLSFSPDSSMLLSVGQDDDHSVALWRSPSKAWTDGTRLANSKGDRNKVLFSSFLSATEAVTGGKDHILFWDVSSQGLKAKKGLFGKPELKRSKVLTCSTAVGGKIVTGVASGDLYVWGGRDIAKVVKAHEGGVTAVCGYESTLVSGGKNGQIRLWNAELELQSSFDLTAASPAPYVPAISSVCLNADNSLILAGTAGSEIYEVTVASKRYLQLVEGHCKEELWGLATHPKSDRLVVTAGDDFTVRVWDLEEHRPVRKTVLDSRTRCVAWSPDGSLIAAGLGGRIGGVDPGKKDGGVVVLRSDNLQQVHYARDAKKWLSDIKFSPDGSTLGISSHDCKLYLYDARGGRFTPKGVCSKHTAYLTHFDFSADSQVLQSNCGGYELLFFKANSGDQITSASSLRDTEWASWTCVLGWPVQGIFPPTFDGTDINGVDRSHNRSWVATSDDKGVVKVYNWPCLTNEAKHVDGLGHASHVTNVRWSLSDSYLLTTGGNDRTLMQWRVTK